MSLSATARPYSAGEVPQSSVLKFRNESFLLNSIFICIGDILYLHFYVNAKEYKIVKWEVIWENTISVYVVVMQLPSQLMPMPLVTCLAHQSLVASAVILSTSSQYYLPCVHQHCYSCSSFRNLIVFILITFSIGCKFFLCFKRNLSFLSFFILF